MGLKWISDTRFEVDGVRFIVDPVVAGLDRRAEGDNSARDVEVDETAIAVYKPRWMLDRYAELAVPGDANVFELGIYSGGSTVFLADFYRPKRLAAVELREGTWPTADWLDRYIEEHALTDVHPYFGVDQADRERITEIAAGFDGPLDLVVDDASHRFAETAASFNLLFPLLRPGGLYVIEDWSWEHSLEATVGTKGAADARRLAAGELLDGEYPLSRLVFQLVLASAYADRAVAEVSSVRRGWAVVRRGDAVLGDDFRVEDCYGRLGRAMLGQIS